MPRGTRHIGHGSDLRQASTDTAPTVTKESHVIAQCWCRSGYVRVPTIYICRGNTGSCGRDTCRPPDPRPPAPCVPVEPKGASWKPVDPGPGDDREYKERCAPDDRLIKHTRERAPRGMTANEKRTEVNQRRDMVEALWQQGKKMVDIAVRLGLPIHTVNNDLTWLKDNLRVTRNRTERRD